MNAFRTASPFALAGLGLALAAGQAHADLTTFAAPSAAYSVSADGQSATFGTAGGHVFLWTAGSNTLTDVGGLVGSGAKAVLSADGSVIAASGKDASNKSAAAIYSTGTGTWTIVPSLGGSTSTTASATYAISADGRYVGGTSYATGSSTARAWITDTQTGTAIDVGSTSTSRVVGIGPGAQTLVGYTSSQNGTIWNRNGDGSYTQTVLSDPDAPANALNAINTMSSNGLWAAGTSFNNANPYRVNLQTGAVQFYDKLPTEPGDKATATSSGITADGNTIVGSYAPQGASLLGSTAYIWQADGTVSGNLLGGTAMSFDDYLTAHGIDLDNHYNFLSVASISADGTVFAGTAFDNTVAGGALVGFVVTVPEPSQYALLASGLVLVGLVTRRRRTHG